MIGLLSWTFINRKNMFLNGPQEERKQINSTFLSKSCEVAEVLRKPCTGKSAKASSFSNLFVDNFYAAGKSQWSGNYGTILETGQALVFLWLLSG